MYVVPSIAVIIEKEFEEIVRKAKSLERGTLTLSLYSKGWLVKATES